MSDVSAAPTPRDADGSAPASATASLQFPVRHAGVQLKITLDEKWQARPLLSSVVAPFVKAFNKKRPLDAVHEDGLVGVLVKRSGEPPAEEWADPSQPAAKSCLLYTSPSPRDS